MPNFQALKFTERVLNDITRKKNIQIVPYLIKPPQKILESKISNPQIQTVCLSFGSINGNCAQRYLATGARLLIKHKTHAVVLLSR